MKLSQLSIGRDNNFNLIRVFAAYAVLISHSYVISSGMGDSEPNIHGLSLGGAALHIFFIISGFLITASLLRSKSLIEYFWSRFLRIFPALFFLATIVTFGLGLFFTNFSCMEYLSKSDTYLYFIKCITLLRGIEFELPGVFNDNPHKNIVNGSLWSLPKEVRLYVFLAIVYWVTFKIKPVKSEILFFMAILLSYLITFFKLLNNDIFNFSQGGSNNLSLMFFSGSLFYFLRDWVKISSKIFLLVAAILLLAMIDKKVFVIFYLISLPYLTLFLAHTPSVLFRKYNKIGDYSYGIYIYAWPVQQSIVSLLPNISVTLIILYSSLITLSLSLISWHFIEVRFLGLKKSSVFHSKK